MARSPASTGSRATPAAQLAGFVARFDPAIARLVRGARRVLRQRFPTAIELVYDNYNALAIGWSGSERVSDGFVSIAVYATGVSLYFTYGASLPDPTGRLEGAGRQGRFVRLPDLSVLKEPAVVALLEAAVTTARAPLPAAGRSRTVIKSVSAKQRPRRPPALRAR